jgi:hypothetical protein
MRLLFLLLLPLAICPSATAAEEDDAAAKEKNQAQRLEFMKAQAAGYRFAAADSDRRELQIVAEPLLRWTNPVSGLQDGTLFLWTEKSGRPAAAAQVFLTADNLWLHEFQSLYEGPFSAQRDGEPVWEPSRAGISFKKLAGAPTPASTAVKRLSQMRQLANRFTANDEFEGKSRWELRMLAKPLLRYADEKAGLLDGAMFALAHGTDPEVFILLEARQSDGDYAWHYALAPMTGYALKAQLDGKETWAVEWRKGPYKTTDPFYITVFKKEASPK